MPEGQYFDMIKNIVNRSVLDTEAVFGGKYLAGIDAIKKAVLHCKGLGLKIVFTQGTWDLLHIGHARYFKEAKKHGDILIVAVDSDEKVRVRKGPERPIVPQGERAEMVSHINYVDLVVIKELHFPKWHLTKIIKPDVLIATQETYTRKEIKDLEKHCKRVVVLKPQATTSTSAKIRRLQIATAKKLEKELTPRVVSLIGEVLGKLKG